MATARQPAQGPLPVTADVRVFIARRPEAVFDYFADLRNEPEYNRQVRGILKTSPDPIGANTSFEGLHRGFGRVTWRLAEYERPRHVAIEGIVGRGLYRWVSDLEPASNGTWLNGHMEWRPPAPWRHFRALLGRLLAWNARRAFRRFAAVVESRTSAG